MMKYILGLMAVLLAINTGAAYTLIGQNLIDETLNNEGIAHIAQSSSDGTGYAVYLYTSNTYDFGVAVGAISAALLLEGNPNYNGAVAYPTSSTTALVTRITYADATVFVDAVSRGDTQTMFNRLLMLYTETRSI